jgi:hypothetical protein
LGTLYNLSRIQFSYLYEVGIVLIDQRQLLVEKAILWGPPFRPGGISISRKDMKQKLVQIPVKKVRYYKKCTSR